MKNELIQTEQNALTVNDLLNRVNLHKRVQKEVMKENVHYGVIPGCGNKKTLLKPGYEVLLLAFHLGIYFDVEDLCVVDIVRYRIKSKIINLASGQVICEGVGEASSEEEKYKWKKAFCNEEYDDYDASRKRLKWKKVYKTGEFYQEKQIRTNPADIANTILKMSKKRCGVDGTITATGCSDTYTQDEGDDENGDSQTKPPMSPPQSKSSKAKQTTNGMATKPQLGKLHALINGIMDDETPETVKHRYVADLIGKENIESYKDLTIGEASEAISKLMEESKKTKSPGEEKASF